MESSIYADIIVSNLLPKEKSVGQFIIRARRIFILTIDNIGKRFQFRFYIYLAILLSLVAITDFFTNPNTMPIAWEQSTSHVQVMTHLPTLMYWTVSG